MPFFMIPLIPSSAAKELPEVEAEEEDFPDLFAEEECEELVAEEVLKGVDGEVGSAEDVEDESSSEFASVGVVEEEEELPNCRQRR